MFRVGKKFGFSAGHWLDGVPEGHKCRRPHGHNYEVEVVLECNELDSGGMVADFGELAFVRDWIDANWDHRVLNECSPFVDMGLQTTAEEIARAVGELVIAARPEWKLAGVRVSETASCWAEWVPDW